MTQLQKSTSSSLSSLGNSLIHDTELTPYQVRISRERPGCFVFLIDQSGSMSSEWGNDNSKSKADLVALYVNDAINEIINMCQKSELEPRPYFHICVIGYGASSEATVLWEGALSAKTFVTPAELKQNPTGQNEKEIVRRTFKGETKVKLPVPYWFSPRAIRSTPMGNALDLCTGTISEWVSEHPNSFPPIVINITDGEQTDCSDEELLQKAAQLKAVTTLYGNTLFFNAHISDEANTAVLFPEKRADLPSSRQCGVLYDMSSTLPEIFKRRIAHTIKNTDLRSDTNYVAMTYQGSIGDLTRFLDIGTKTLEP